MRHPTLAVLAAVSLFAAGCSADVDDDPLGLSEAEETPTPTTDLDPPPPVEPALMEFFLTTDHGLSSTRPPSRGEVPQTIGFTDTQFLLGQRRFAPWKLTPALPLAWVATQASLDLFYHSNYPQQSWSSSFGAKPVGTWYGEENRWLDTFYLDAPAQLTAGQLARVNQTLPVPRGGYVYEAGAAPALMLSFFYTQSAQNPILVRTGGSEASVLRLTMLPYELPRVARVTEKLHEGAFAYNSFGVPHPDAAQRERFFDLELPRIPVKVEIDLDGSTAALNQDLDLSLFDPGGNQVWASTGPHAREALRLYDVNFQEHGPGTYKIRVENFLTINGSFKVTVKVHEAADE